MVCVAQRILAQRGGVAIVGHENRNAGAGGKFPPDVRAHPVVAEIRAAPDHAVAARCGHVQADSSNGTARHPGSRRELVECLVELAEGRFVAVLHLAPDFRQRSHLLGEVIDQNRFNGGAADVETGVIG